MAREPEAPSCEPAREIQRVALPAGEGMDVEQ